MAKPFVSAADQMAAATHETQSLTPAMHGRLSRTGSVSEWDMSYEWQGRELTHFTIRRTLWGARTVVWFQFKLVMGGHYTEFILSLSPDFTDEEVNAMCENYMLILNMRRAAV